MNARSQIQGILKSSNFPPRSNKKKFSRTPFYLPWNDEIGQKGGERKIDRKIIINADTFDGAIVSFLISDRIRPIH